MSVTTLEQVFLEIGHDPNPKPKVLASSGSGNIHQEPMNTPSADGNATPDIGAALRRKGPQDITANDDGSAMNSHSERRLVSDKAQASFLPPIVSAKTPND